MYKLKRSKNNPVLSPHLKCDWEDQAVFNPAVFKKDNKIWMLYRAVGEYDVYKSSFGLAVSDDGDKFERVSDKPVFGPKENYDLWATEDPRAVLIDDTVFVTYTAISRQILNYEGEDPLLARSALFETKDFKDITRRGVITPRFADDKNSLLFPEKFEGRYMLLHRPARWSKRWIDDPAYGDMPIETPIAREFLPDLPSIWIAYSDDLIHWDNHALVLTPEHEIDKRIGPGVPPIKTKEGWLMIYHHVDDITPETPIIDMRYCARVALLSLDDPSKVIAKLPYAILEPEESYEKEGDVEDVVFPTGAYVEGDTLHVYYGAADKYCAHATGSLAGLLSELSRYPV